LNPDSTAYSPSDDTFLLIDAIEGRGGRRALEIGTGTGLLLSQLSRTHEWTVGTDVSLSAVKAAAARFRSDVGMKIDLVCCDAASAFRGRTFGLVVFNPPYLPSSSPEDLAVDGGPGGTEVTAQIFDEAARVVTAQGSVVFVVSSLSDYPSMVTRVEREGFCVRTLGTRKLFFEQLFALEATRNQRSRKSTLPRSNII